MRWGSSVAAPASVSLGFLHGTDLTVGSDGEKDLADRKYERTRSARLGKYPYFIFFKWGGVSGRIQEARIPPRTSLLGATSVHLVHLSRSQLTLVGPSIVPPKEDPPLGGSHQVPPMKETQST